MKKALTIVLVVAVYSLCETLLLLLSITPNCPYLDPHIYQWITWWGQLLLIPGLAALFSRLIYGSSRWGVRALTIVVVSVATVVFMVAFAYAVHVFSSVTWASPLAVAAFAISILLLGSGIGAGLFFFFRNVVRRTAEIEIDRWLAERRAGTSTSSIRWRNRGIRWASWIPAIMVLLAFSFLPEIWGTLSHITSPHSGTVRPYRVVIPITWIVLAQDEHGREGYVRGLAGRGIALDFERYLHNDLPLSSWHISVTEPSQSQESAYRRWTRKDNEILVRRTVTIGNENVTCVEYWPSYLVRPEHIETSPSAFIECSGTRLSASLVGERIHVSAFYRMLKSLQTQ